MWRIMQSCPISPVLCGGMVDIGLRSRKERNVAGVVLQVSLNVFTLCFFTVTTGINKSSYLNVNAGLPLPS